MFRIDSLAHLDTQFESTYSQKALHKHSQDLLQEKRADSYEFCSQQGELPINSGGYCYQSDGLVINSSLQNENSSTCLTSLSKASNTWVITEEERMRLEILFEKYYQTTKLAKRCITVLNTLIYECECGVAEMENGKFPSARTKSNYYRKWQEKEILENISSCLNEKNQKLWLKIIKDRPKPLDYRALISSNYIDDSNWPMWRNYFLPSECSPEQEKKIRNIANRVLFHIGEQVSWSQMKSYQDERLLGKAGLYYWLNKGTLSQICNSQLNDSSAPPIIQRIKQFLETTKPAKYTRIALPKHFVKTELSKEEIQNIMPLIAPNVTNKQELDVKKEIVEAGLTILKNELNWSVVKVRPYGSVTVRAHYLFWKIMGILDQFKQYLREEYQEYIERHNRSGTCIRQVNLENLGTQTLLYLQELAKNVKTSQSTDAPSWGTCPSNLSYIEWNAIQRLLDSIPQLNSQAFNYSRIFNVILFQRIINIPWNKLPEDLPQYREVLEKLSLLCQFGLLRVILEIPILNETKRNILKEFFQTHLPRRMLESEKGRKFFIENPVVSYPPKEGEVQIRPERCSQIFQHEVGPYRIFNFEGLSSTSPDGYNCAATFKVETRAPQIVSQELSEVALTTINEPRFSIEIPTKQEDSFEFNENAAEDFIPSPLLCTKGVSIDNSWSCMSQTTLEEYPLFDIDLQKLSDSFTDQFFS